MRYWDDPTAADQAETRPVPEGWVARRWDPAVRERFCKLLRVMGQALDGKIEGLNLPETAIGFGENGRHHPPGYSFEGYRDAVCEIIAFPLGGLAALAAGEGCISN